jgi:hypothetical protein
MSSFVTCRFKLPILSRYNYEHIILRQENEQKTILQRLKVLVGYRTSMNLYGKRIQKNWTNYEYKFQCSDWLQNHSSYFMNDFYS